MQQARSMHVHSAGLAPMAGETQAILRVCMGSGMNEGRLSRQEALQCGKGCLAEDAELETDQRPRPGNQHIL